jgi:predicted  nucleic acid-binding Zn-ribbon protein
MKEQEFQQRLDDLLAQIEQLPPEERERLQRLADETRERHTRMRKTVSQLQESLDYLRLSVKYLVFDLEATRRENQYLRKMLGNAGGLDVGEGAD